MNKLLKSILIITFTGICHSCDRPEMEYTIQEKQISVKEATIYIDGFLAKGAPAFEGNENEPADRIGIPFINGFGRKLRVEFTDQSEETGLTIEGGDVELAYQGDQQYAYFNVTGTPKVSGLVPISFKVLEDGKQIGQTIVKPLRIWEEGTTRPSRDMIPTGERPFVFVEAELNWVNQSAPTAQASNPQIFWYAGMGHPTTQINVSGTKYSCVVNLRYNSILIANNAICPDNVGGNTGSLTVFAPTAENLEQYPEAFQLKNGLPSSVWGEKDIFFHGTNSKPITVGMWDPNTPDHVVSGNRARPLSSLSWNISSTTPYGCRFEKEGTYKIYVKYVNNDSGNDVIQYFPKHPVTGEAGWVPYEFTITKNPLSGFVIDPGITNDNGVPTYNEDWQPTEEHPVKAVRGELIYNNSPRDLIKGQELGASNGSIRIWFVTYKPEGATTPIGYNFKACQQTGYLNGFKNSEVESIAGANSRVGAGSANQSTSKAIHYFEDPTLNDKYFVSYVDFNAAPNTVLMNSGTYTFTFESLPNSGTANPKIPEGFTCPVTIKAIELP